MRRYMRRGMTGREKRRLLLFLVCAALIALAVTAMMQLRPILTSLATARVSNAVTRVVNTSVNETLYDAGVDYDRLISLEKDNEGHITAVKSNMAEFNRLQSAVLADVLQRLSEVSTRELAIPLGSLTGSRAAGRSCTSKCSRSARPRRTLRMPSPPRASTRRATRSGWWWTCM